ncbi:MAG: MORN repeat-containing protein [Reyranella sp.]
MNARLCLIALFLVAFPVAAQNPQPGWIADAKTGCRVWSLNPNPARTVTWSGSCQNGLAQGRGVMQAFQAGQPFARYEGELRDGKANGRGLYTYASGNRYEGEWRDDQRNGRGVFTWTDGSRYEGEWRDNRENGRGVHTWPSGNRFEGEWRNGKPNGSGTLYQRTDGETFTGTWTNGCFRQGNRRAAAAVTNKECGIE